MATKRKSTSKPKNRLTTLKATARKVRHKGSPRTKTESIIALLKRPKGASIPQLQKATGWQPHSVRAALTGLRKKGFEVQRTKGAKGASVYSITRTP